MMLSRSQRPGRDVGEYKTLHVGSGMSMQGLVRHDKYLEQYSLFDREPMKFLQDRGYVVKLYIAYCFCLIPIVVECKWYEEGWEPHIISVQSRHKNLS